MGRTCFSFFQHRDPFFKLSSHESFILECVMPPFGPINFSRPIIRGWKKSMRTSAWERWKTVPSSWSENFLKTTCWTWRQPTPHCRQWKWSSFAVQNTFATCMLFAYLHNWWKSELQIFFCSLLSFLHPQRCWLEWTLCWLVCPGGTF